jgi:hypothetical protein
MVRNVKISKRRRSNMSNTKVIAYSKWSKGGGGEYPARIVVLKWSKKEYEPYSSHEEIKDGVHADNYMTGHYFSTFDDALADMLKRVKYYNTKYSLGNPSHIPAGITVTGK